MTVVLMMENIMNAVNTVMSACRESLDSTNDDYERVTILLRIIYNIARLAGEQGVPRRQITDNVLGAVAAGYETVVPDIASERTEH
jgi:hypothetical protein